MKENLELDYNQHYDKILATKEELKKIKASDFLQYFSDLIIKYSNQLEDKIKCKSEES
ncbi:hypothetical protein ACLM5H_11745 [Fredinandcohnia humi]